MQKAKLGDRVRIEYSRLHKRGTAAAKPRPPQVLEFTAGSSDIIPCVSLGVVGMSPGEQKQLTFKPQNADSMVSAGLTKQKPRKLPAKPLKLSVGQPRTAAKKSPSPRPRLRVIGGDPVVVELKITLLSLDSSSNANKRKQQFDIGGGT